ncbi:3-ketosteroid-9-alpha-hydroxylase (plasmid) [Vibrio alfacsensis]|uniref:3-ketosteroid-9-alpha-hydroxylase n=1 Tax=Vibrio alfacsensis TaxID=1074311 RepID=A0ABN5PKK5_9VIBR|nr:ferredoxin--NADP reductase [Vibrio alfacsensis]AXY03704.1 3-ketosteroid-9-alpha-hydroxylase [Vibrio alfacsensis]
MQATQYYSLVVKHVVQETEDAISLQFDVPQAARSLFHYQPGQFITLRVTINGESQVRCYSMSSSPEVDDFLQVSVKRVKDGRVSNYLCDNIKSGDVVEIMPPSGVFVPKHFNDELLLFAGGSGITPVYSILRTALTQGNARIRLIYANRDQQSVIFKDALKTLQADYPQRLEVIHLLESLSGIPSQSLLTSLASGMQSSSQVFICGPGPFMDAVESALVNVDIPSSAIHLERFVASSSNDKPIQSGPDDEITTCETTLEIGRETHQFSWQSDETLLDAAEKAGLELPYSCCSGLCASCMCEVVDGEVSMLVNEVLDERDIKQNLILSCQAIPHSKTAKIRFT